MGRIVITITGHRLLSNEQREKLKPVIRKAIENIMFISNERGAAHSFVALSPLAEGADTMFAQAAKGLGVPLRILLPFEKEEYLKDFMSDEAKNEFYSLYDSVSDTEKSFLNKRGEHEYNQLFLDLGRKIVEEADFLIAIWNEKPAKGKGGTGDIVAYAQEMKKDILLIDPEDEHPFINYLHPENYKRKYTGEVIDTLTTNHLTTFIDSKQQEHDANAALFNKKYKRLWTIGFVVGLIEVLAFSIITAFQVELTLHFVLASVEFCCIAAILLLLIFGQSKKMHSNYVHNRIVGERLRIKRFFSELGLRIYHVAVSPIYFSFKEKPEYRILDNTIRLINLSAYSYLPFETKKKQLETELIIDQHKYHERKQEKFEKRNQLYKRVRSVLFLLVVGAVILHFAHVANEYLDHHDIHLLSWLPHFMHSEVFSQVLIFLSIFIPATIAACEALKYLYEWEKIITLSRSMSGYFKEKEHELKHVNSDEQLERFLNDINKDMLIENLDWEKYMQDKSEVPA